MTDRDKLVELVKDICNTVVKACGCSDMMPTYSFNKKAVYDKIADHLIANGVTVQGWINVKDGLPDVEKETNALQITQTVQATDGKETFFGRFMIYKYNGLWMFVCVDENVDLCSTDEITHWIPLHDLPKEES